MKRFNLLLTIVLFVTFSSCKTLTKLVNENYPPLNASVQQIASIEQNLVHIDSINSEIGVYLNEKVLNKYLPLEIKKSVENVKDENLEIKKFEPILDFKNQAIVVNGKFSIYVPEHKVTIDGELKGLSSVSTVQDSLYLRNAFKTLKINRIVFDSKPTLKKRVLAKLISPILNNFITNINGELFKNPSSIYLGWEKPLSFNPKSIFNGASTEVTSSTKVINRYLKESSILIDKTGISILIEVGKNQIKQEIDSIASSPSKMSVSKLFKEFSNKFEENWKGSFEEKEDKMGVSLAIKKELLASVLNEALSDNFMIKAKLENRSEKFSSKIEVENSKINCQKVRTKFTYPPFNGQSCNWSCPGWDPVCHSTRAACNVHREAERVVWQAAREAARIAHQAANETKVGLCDVWRNTNDFLALGKFSGNTSGNGNANLNFKQFQFSKDLSKIDINFSGGIDYNLKSNINILPMDLGHVFLCLVKYQKSSNSNIRINLEEQISTLSLLTRKEGNDLVMSIQISPIHYNAQINPSPLHEMYKDPVFIGSCSFFSTLIIPLITAGSLTGVIDLEPEQELILFGKANGSFKPDEITNVIEPLKFKINNGSDKVSLIQWKPSTIAFEYLLDN